MLSEKYKELLAKIPRRTNECWLGNMDTDEELYVCGHKFLIRLEGTDLKIWKLMNGRWTVQEIVDLLAKEYVRDKREHILEDTISFILQLEKVGVAAWRSRPLFEDIKIDD